MEDCRRATSTAKALNTRGTPTVDVPSSAPARRCRLASASGCLFDSQPVDEIGLKGRVRQLWWYQIALSLMELARLPRETVTALISKAENRQDVIEVERIVGRILGLLRWGNKYGWSCRHVRYAPWR